MFELEPAVEALRTALDDYGRDRDPDALLPSLYAYGRAARHHGRSLDDASAQLRALYKEGCGGERAGVRHRQRCVRLMRALAAVYTKPTTDVTIGRG